MSTHVLTVNASAISKVDAANPYNLYGIWVVFSRCADSLKQGHRLENLSWRLWQKEQLVKNTKRLGAITAIKTLPLTAPSPPQEPPQLSSSVESLVDEGTTKFASGSPSKHERHISSHEFIQMVISIVNDTTPLSASTATFPLTALKIETALPAPAPIATETITQKKAPAKFALGGSCSSSEQDMIVELSKPSLVSGPNKAMTQIGGSSEFTSTKIAIKPAKALGPQKIKQPVIAASHNSQLKAECAMDSNTENDYVNESAIDDDDDPSDWEDCMEHSGKSSVDDMFFQRVESKANLVSRPSLITLMLAQNERQKNLSNQAPHSASTITQSRAGTSAPILRASQHSNKDPLIMKGMRSPNLRPIIEVPRSSAQPIVAPVNHVHAKVFLSPGTTRCNMLATEMTESLRRNLLWERQQKTSTANAVLKRRHTSHDVANLEKFPKKPYLKQNKDANASSWNQYFNRDTLDGYHSKGW
ncbi:hypothetical protein G3M48_004640 [Beauveria asiatica]|uniref:Nitrogen regulatory protein areA GATA-like domain-containing protein n=1 Tax=Beauveria asiatica TaxID=1069075 RepID=A0AAW0RSW0_9HYPO